MCGWSMITRTKVRPEFYRYVDDKGEGEFGRVLPRPSFFKEATIGGMQPVFKAFT